MVWPIAARGPNHESNVTCGLKGHTQVRGWGVGQERALLTISHEDDDVAGAVPALGRCVPRPAHHVVHGHEGLLGVRPRLQFVICRQKRG